jgi:hypothetical protein
MPARSIICSSILALSAFPCGLSSAELPKPLGAFMDRHCVECHDADVKKGGLDLAALPFDLNDASAFKEWQRIFERVRDGEMPPAKKPQPAKGDSQQFVAGLKQPLLQADAADVAKNGRVRSRRLTRTEYEHTVHDLLGIDIPLKQLLPEDRVSHGFETVAEGQQLSHHQLARYLDVADLALDEAFDRAFDGDKTFQRHCTPEDLAVPPRGNYRGPDLRDGKSISWPIGLQFFGRLPATEVRADGWYRITLHDVEAINPGRNGSVWGTLRSGACASNAPMLYMIGLVEASSTPRDLVFEAWIQRGHMLELRPNDGTLKRAANGAKGGNVSFEGRDLERDGFAGIAHRGIDLERIHPGGDRVTVKRKLFGDIDVKQGSAKVLDRLVTEFASRAFRRPVTDAQVAPYREMGREVLASGRSLREAARTSYRAILCSPRFLTFIEEPGALDDHAIASRLSYALWVSMPDAALTKLANEGTLHQPAVLQQQIDRMLADPKSKRFVNSFTDQWLKLKEIDFTSADTRQFPTFDPVVQESMLQETRAYVTELIEKDLGITHLVDSDFAFMNERLARHYAGNEEKGRGEDGRKRKKDQRGDNDEEDEVPTADAPRFQHLVTSDLTPGKGLQKVSLDPAAPRGGLVTQGAVLKVTADGTITSPVVRGVFINERILGEHIPPPPPGIPAIEPDVRGATSIRDQLNKHRSNESCASCHQTIDPPGFALENFDPVGGWRERYGKEGVKVDPSGKTPEGAAFDGLVAWKKIYQQRSEQLARGFAQQFLTYVTGAPMRMSDEKAVSKIVGDSRTSSYGVRSLMRGVLTSPIFLEK